jgi:DNA-binding NarL/FixJ family response regulator
MPHTNGTELISKVAAASPGTRIVVYTGEATTVFAAEALEAGAHGVMLKEAPLVDLVRAFRAVLGGDYYVDPALLHPPTDRSGTLTERERAVLLLLAEGYEQKEIGRRLSIGAETVRTHAQKARRRLGASTSTQAVAEAIRSGLLE